MINVILCSVTPMRAKLFLYTEMSKIIVFDMQNSASVIPYC